MSSVLCSPPTTLYQFIRVLGFSLASQCSAFIQFCKGGPSKGAPPSHFHYPSSNRNPSFGVTILLRLNWGGGWTSPLSTLGEEGESFRRRIFEIFCKICASLPVNRGRWCRTNASPTFVRFSKFSIAIVSALLPSLPILADDFVPARGGRSGAPQNPFLSLIFARHSARQVSSYLVCASFFMERQLLNTNILRNSAHLTRRGGNWRNCRIHAVTTVPFFRFYYSNSVWLFFSGKLKSVYFKFLQPGSADL